jgi:hypothetical protein
MSPSNLRRLLFAGSLSLVGNLAVSGQDANSLATSFPFQISIDSVQEVDATANISPERLAEASVDGMEIPYFVFFRGKIDGEGHWIFSCRKENKLRESIPCTTIPTGNYRGRWVHNYSIMQIVGGEPSNQISRFLTVESNPKNPLVGDDPILHYGVFDFPVQFPKNKTVADYPILVHVYGGQSLEFQAGSIPGQTRCNIRDGAYQATINCTEYPPIAIHRGYVTLDISAGEITFASLHCEAKWAWSHCSVLDPGLYYARMDDSGRVMLLVHDEDGKPREIGYSIQTPRSGVQSPIK